MVRLPLNEDMVHLYIMTSLYVQETDVVKVGIGKDPIRRAREVGGEVKFKSKTAPTRNIIYRKDFAPAPIVLVRLGKGTETLWLK
jgi:hypothetical protein